MPVDVGKDLLDELKNFSFKFDDKIIDKLKVLLGNEDDNEFVDDFLTFCISKNLLDKTITEELVDEFAKDKAMIDIEHKSSNKFLPTPVIGSVMSESINAGNIWLENDIDKIYGITPDRVSIVLPQSSSTPLIQNRKFNNKSDIDSPNNSSLNVSSSKLMGDSFVSSLGKSDCFISNRPQHKGTCVLDIKPYTEKNFMFQKVSTLVNHLESQLINLARQIQSENVDTRNFHPLGDVSLESVHVFGRIKTMPFGVRPKPNNLYIEASIQHCEGKSIRLDIGEVNSASVYPGQVVLVEGTHPTPDTFIASKIFSSTSFGVTSAARPKCRLRGIVTAGPYFQDDFDPSVVSLIKEIIQTTRPDIFLFIGPFVQESSNPKVGGYEVSYWNLFDQMIKGVMAEAAKSGTKVLIIPSINDACAIPMFPQTPMLSRKIVGCEFLPNPCTFRANSFNLAASSMDILIHMSAVELSHGDQTNDRISRILKHILNHKSFYPIYPPNSESLLDFNNMSSCNIDSEPHILVISSNLCPFVKKIDNTICINPSQFLKSKGYSYCRFQLTSDESGHISLDDSIIQVIKAHN